MKRLIVKGDFVETSQSDKEFLREIRKILQEKSEGYYSIAFRNEFTRNKYQNEFAKLFGKYRSPSSKSNQDKVKLFMGSK